ncbi:MAG: GDP-mannose 4,6-dehydratase [Deltaproteobacteria bacterium]|nr:GDP-mannose 4,6-dehydratase [Deltaproteobacteria bacterium]
MNHPLYGKTVLVTGADGFIGSHLCEQLVALGAKVRAFCLYNSHGSWGWLDHASPDVRSSLDVRLGDVRDARLVEDACRATDVVFHLAALIAIPYSYVAPESFVETNVRGTINVLEGARRAGTSRVVHTSTSEVYGTPKHTPIRETHPLQAQSPYAATKVAADQLALAWHASYELPVVILRPFNTYGPRQSTRAVLPTMLAQLLARRDEIELGRLDPKRDLTFVSDTVHGFIRAAVAPNVEGEVIQLGTGRAVSIGDLFEMACKVTNHRAQVRHDPRRMRPNASEVMILESDPTLARERLQWEAVVTLEDGLRQTAEFIQANPALYRTDYLHL